MRAKKPVLEDRRNVLRFGLNVAYGENRVGPRMTTNIRKTDPPTQVLIGGCGRIPTLRSRLHEFFDCKVYDTSGAGRNDLQTFFGTSQEMFERRKTVAGWG